MNAPPMSFFDLDHTLLKVNSSFRFGLYLYRCGVFSCATMLYLAGCYWLHKIGILSIQTLQNMVFKRLFLGRPFSFMHAFAKSFLDQQFDQMLYLPAVRRLQQAQQQGHYTVILSSSPHFLVALFAERLGVNEWDGTDYALDPNHCFSAISRFMLGADKAHSLVALAERLGTSKKDITAYSDSHLDLSFLQAAGTAVGVNPNKTLRILCKQNNWQTL